jgi:hypothetical protein
VSGFTDLGQALAGTTACAHGGRRPLLRANTNTRLTISKRAAGRERLPHHRHLGP